MKTALEWYSSELEMLILKHNFKKISRVEFVKAKKELFIKAKEWEEIQLSQAFYAPIDIETPKNFEDYYKEKYLT